MPLVIDEQPQIAASTCYGLHIRWIGFRTTYRKLYGKRWYQWRLVAIRRSRWDREKHRLVLWTEVHSIQQMEAWTLIAVPWHLFWRRRGDRRVV